MKKKFKMQNLDCANCAAKMEDAIKKIPGVKSASMNFIMQRLTLDADENRLAEIISEAQKRCSAIEPDATIITD